MVSRIEEKVRAELCCSQLANLATISGGVPWTRYVMISTDQHMMIRCCSYLQARKVQQIKQQPQVHLCCGVSSLMKMKPYLQIQAVAHVTTAESERRAFWSPVLQHLFTGPDDPDYAVVMMLPYRVEYWTPQATEPGVWHVRDKAEVMQFVEGAHPLLPAS